MHWSLIKVELNINLSITKYLKWFKLITMYLNVILCYIYKNFIGKLNVSLIPVVIATPTNI